VHQHLAAKGLQATTDTIVAKDAVLGDFSTIAGAKAVAEGVNSLGRFNAVIHNAGIGYRELRRADRHPACRTYSRSIYWRRIF
jgi:hypothetical protein